MVSRKRLLLLSGSSTTPLSKHSAINLQNSPVQSSERVRLCLGFQPGKGKTAVILAHAKKRLGPILQTATGFARENVVVPLLEGQKLSPTVERALAQVELAPRRCGLCRNFNLKDGQTSLAQDSVMRAVIAAITPDQYSAAQKNAVNTKENEFDEFASGTHLRPGKVHSWFQYGACTATRELVHEDAKSMEGRPCQGKKWL